MQLTLRVRVPSGVSKRDQKLAKQIESYFIKQVNSKFGKRVEISNRYKTKREPIDVSKLTKTMKVKLHKQIIEKYNSQPQKITILQYWQEISSMELFEQANVSKRVCNQMIKREKKNVRDTIRPRRR